MGSLRLALLAALVAAPASASDLRAMTDRSHILGWEAVGRLDDGSRGGTCSASLIAPDLVLTAAHCLFGETREDRSDPTGLTFHAGFRDGETIASAPVARAVVPEEFDPGELDFLRFLRHDVALLELAEPIPATTASPFNLSRSAGTGAEVTVVSYGQSRMNAASRQSGCEIIAQGRGVMAFDCEGEPGSSGAPIFDMSGRTPRIVAVISAGGDYQGRPAVFGAELTDAVADLRQALRTGRGVWPDRATPEARRIVSGREMRGAGGARFVRP